MASATCREMNYLGEKVNSYLMQNASPKRVLRHESINLANNYYMHVASYLLVVCRSILAVSSLAERPQN